MMASRGQNGASLGQSLQTLISGVEEVLRLAEPAEKQVKGLLSYMRLTQSKDVEEKLQALNTENDTLKNEILELKSSGCESMGKVFDKVERALQLAKEEACGIQRSYEQQGRTSKDNCKIMQMELDDLQQKNEEQNERIRKLTEERDSLQTILDSQMQHIRSLEEERNTMKDTLTINNNSYEDELRKVNIEKDALTETVAKQKIALDEIKTQYEALQKANENLRADLTTRSCLPTDGNNTPIDVAVLSNDPRMIAELYTNLYDNSWRDVYKVAEKLMPSSSERSIICTIVKVLELANTFCKEISIQQKIYLKKTIKLESKHFQENKQVETYVLKQMQRCTTDMVIDILFQAFRKSLCSVNTIEKLVDENRSFARGCIQICWLMNTNEPPIIIQKHIYCDEDFDDASYMEFSCKGDNVDLVVWPAIVSEDGSVIAKGVAQFAPLKNVSTTQTPGNPNRELVTACQTVRQCVDAIEKPITTTEKESDPEREEYPKELTPSDIELKKYYGFKKLYSDSIVKNLIGEDIFKKCYKFLKWKSLHKGSAC